MRRIFVGLGSVVLILVLCGAANNYTLPSQNILASYTAQTIGAGGIIAADSCGGIKLVTAAGAVSTDATNAFAVASIAGCWMWVRNSGANTITILHSANILTLTGANLALAANSVVAFGTDGSKWYQLAPLGTNS